MSPSKGKGGTPSKSKDHKGKKTIPKSLQSFGSRIRKAVQRIPVPKFAQKLFKKGVKKSPEWFSEAAGARSMDLGNNIDHNTQFENQSVPRNFGGVISFPDIIVERPHYSPQPGPSSRRTSSPVAGPSGTSSPVTRRMTLRSGHRMDFGVVADDLFNASEITSSGDSYAVNAVVEETCKEEEEEPDIDAAGVVIHIEPNLPPLRKSDLRDDYNPLKMIGVGAFAEVIHVKNKATGAERAVKKMLNVTDEGKIKNAAREIQILAQLDNDCITRLWDSFSNGDDIYLVMDLCHGDLYDFMDKQAVEPQFTKFVFHETLKALKYIHGLKIMHRDIKPENILVTITGGVKLADFGYARVLAEQNNSQGGTGMLDLTTDTVGTDEFLAPEQVARCRDYTFAVDIWATGWVVAEMIQGGTLIKGERNYVLTLQAIKELCGDFPYEIDDDRGAKMTGYNRKVYDYFLEKTMGDSNTADILCRIMQLDPAMRPSAKTLLKHHYFSSEPYPERLVKKEKQERQYGRRRQKNLEDNS